MHVTLPGVGDTQTGTPLDRVWHVVVLVPVHGRITMSCEWCLRRDPVRAKSGTDSDGWSAHEAACHQTHRLR